MLQHRPRILDGIGDRLGGHGFDSEQTYLDWLDAMRTIAAVSEKVFGDCTWSAPAHENDRYKNAGELRAAFERYRSEK